MIVYMFMKYCNTFLIVSQVYMATFLPDSVCRHNTRMVYLDDHGYDAELGVMETIS